MYSAAIETLLVCKHRIVDLNIYLVKQFYGNKQNITFVSMTDDVYNTCLNYNSRARAII